MITYNINVINVINPGMWKYNQIIAISLNSAVQCDEKRDEKVWSMKISLRNPSLRKWPWCESPTHGCIK